jgi:hypothetical protein
VSPRAQRQAAWVSLLVVAAIATWLRYGLIEPSAMTELCGGSQRPAWCTWRELLVLGFQHHAWGFTVYGTVALLSAALALAFRHAWMAWLAAAAGACALTLYCFEPGALALLIGCLRLLRLQAPVPRPPLDQHRQRQQQVEPQP